MNFNNYFLKSFRVFLLPFSILVGIYIKIRNWLYNTQKIKSIAFNIPIICVGNLVIGGTGKTPMVEYLIALLKEKFVIATISRGYKRKSKGFLIATEKITPLELGDEPYLFYYKNPTQIIAVCENRILAIPTLIQENPQIQTVILDDAFQHRSIQAGLNIILTDYNNIYTQDLYFPAGELRDEKNAAQRANIIIVTKCPENISEEKMIYITHQINKLPTQHLFFTFVKYGEPYHILNQQKIYKLNQQVEILLIFGIANPTDLKEYVHNNCFTYNQMAFNDHHIFSSADFNEIIFKFKQIQHEHKIILTTEKDAVRLLKFKTEFESLPIYVLPIKHQFINQSNNKFDSLVIDFITQFGKNQ